MPGSKTKTRNPGYIPGDHWVIDDIDGMVIRSSEAKVTWDGKVVHPKNFEKRHPQEFVRGLPDDAAAKGLVRPEPEPVFKETDFMEPQHEMPEGTFNN